MNLEILIDLATKQIAGEATQEELNQLNLMLDNKAYRDYYEWLKAQLAKSQDEEKIFDLAYGKVLLQNKIKKYEPQFEFVEMQSNGAKQIFLHKRRLWVGIAASLVILVGFFSIWQYYFLQKSPAMTVENATKPIWLEKITELGQRKKIILPDGSVVLLNAGSKLKYLKDFQGSKRTVYMEGEAYFEVVKNPEKAFQVYAAGTLTEVLGTKFNVQAYNEDTEVKISLVEGKVVVKDTLQSEGDRLTPTQQWLWNKQDKMANISTFNPLQVIGWKENLLFFENESLEIVARRLERHYGVRFEFENESLKKCRVRGNYKNTTLETILKGIQFISNDKIKYELKDKKVFFKGKSC